jgi:ABC-2 type transport system ATP-binding protein
VDAGELLVIHGPARSGRTTLLLTLAGRHRITAGVAEVGGHRLPGDEAAVRRAVVVAQAEPAVGFEGRLRVREVLEEARLVNRLRRPEVEEALAFFELDVPPALLVDELEPATRTLLAVALGWAQRPAVLVVDDADRGCPPLQRRTVWEGLLRANAIGCTLLVGAQERPHPVIPTRSLRMPRLTDERHRRPLPPSGRPATEEGPA